MVQSAVDSDLTIIAVQVPSRPPHRSTRSTQRAFPVGRNRNPLASVLRDDPRPSRFALLLGSRSDHTRSQQRWLRRRRRAAAQAPNDTTLKATKVDQNGHRNSVNFNSTNLTSHDRKIWCHLINEDMSDDVRFVEGEHDESTPRARDPRAVMRDPIASPGMRVLNPPPVGDARFLVSLAHLPPQQTRKQQWGSVEGGAQRVLR